MKSLYFYKLYEKDDIKYILKDEAKVIFSGIIEDKLNSVISKAEEVGLKLLKIEVAKEWRAIIFKRAF